MHELVNVLGPFFEIVAVEYLNSITDLMTFLGELNIFDLPQLAIEPELKTNRPKKGFRPSNPPDECIYEPQGIGVTFSKADEVLYYALSTMTLLINFA